MKPIKPKLSLLDTAPTPLQYLSGLSQELFREIYIKRDDLTPFGGGGNKLRKLEYLMIEALNAQATTIVAVGDPETELSGNLFLDGIFGARVILKRDDGRHKDVQLEEAAKKVIEAEVKKGEQVYFIPMGGSDTTGLLGYMDCARELDAQAKEQQISGATVYVPVGSMGTYLGLYCGLKSIESDLKLIGIAVMPFDMEKLKAYFTQAKEEYGFNFEGDFHVETGYVGKGYNEPEPRIREAIYTMARHEGILLDPCYTGKMFAGVLSMIKEKKIKLGRQVILLHTGGMPGLYAAPHREKIERDVKNQIQVIK